MNNMVRITMPLPNGKYVIGYVNAVHIAGVFPVVAGQHEGLTAIMSASGACLAHVEEAPDEIARRINNAVCDRKDVRSQRRNKIPWW